MDQLVWGADDREVEFAFPGCWELQLPVWMWRLGAIDFLHVGVSFARIEILIC